MASSSDDLQPDAVVGGVADTDVDVGSAAGSDTASSDSGLCMDVKHPDAKKPKISATGASASDSISVGRLRRGMSSNTSMWAEKHLAGQKGPRTLAEFNDWPAYFVSKLSDSGSDLLAEVMHKTELGVQIQSDYSGMGCVEQACAMLRTHTDTLPMPGLDSELVNRRNFTVHRVCDVDPKCRYVLRNHVPCAEHCQHSFADICSRIDTATLSMLQTIEKRWNEHLNDFWAVVGDTNRKVEQRAIAKMCGEAMCQEMIRALDTAGDSIWNDEGFCCTHDRMCPINAPMDGRSVVITTGGNRCLDWSIYGKEMQWSGISVC